MQDVKQKESITQTLEVQNTFKFLLTCVFSICMIDLGFVTYLTWISAPKGYSLKEDAPAKILLIECTFMFVFITLTYITINAKEITQNTKFYITLIFTVCFTFQFFVFFIRMRMSGYGVDYNSLSFFDNTCKGVGEQNCPVVRHLYEYGLDGLSEKQCNNGFYFDATCTAQFTPSKVDEYTADSLEAFVNKEKCNALQLQYSFTDTTWCYYWACSENCLSTRNNVLYGGFVCGIILFFLYLFFYVRYVTSITVNKGLPT